MTKNRNALTIIQLNDSHAYLICTRRCSGRGVKQFIVLREDSVFA